MSELDISMIQDLNRIFGYVFDINDGKVVKMLSKDDDKNRTYIMELGG